MKIVITVFLLVLLLVLPSFGEGYIFNVMEADCIMGRNLLPSYPAGWQQVFHGFTIGDFDGNGHKDMAIACRNFWIVASAPYSWSYIYIVWDVDSLQDYILLNRDCGVVINAPTDLGRAGMNMVTGDINGDGYDELFIGEENLYDYYGKVFIFFGRPREEWVRETYTFYADVTILGSGTPTGSSWFGFDLFLYPREGDGFDLIVGAPRFAGPDGYGGAVYVLPEFYMSPHYAPLTLDVDSLSPFVIYGRGCPHYPNYFLGTGVSSGFDLNGDRIDDMVLFYLREGALVGSGGRPDSGGASLMDFILFGSEDSLWGSGEIDSLGNVSYLLNKSWTNFSPADVDGDGLQDLVFTDVSIMSCSSDTMESGIPRLFVRYNRGDIEPGFIDSLSDFADVTVSGECENDGTGYALATGDFNGDGKGDIFVGSSTRPFYNPTIGYLFFGGDADIFPEHLFDAPVRFEVDSLLALECSGAPWWSLTSCVGAYMNDLNEDGLVDLLFTLMMRSEYFSDFTDQDSTFEVFIFSNRRPQPVLVSPDSVVTDSLEALSFVVRTKFAPLDPNSINLLVNGREYRYPSSALLWNPEDSLLTFTPPAPYNLDSMVIVTFVSLTDSIGTVLDEPVTIRIPTIRSGIEEDIATPGRVSLSAYPNPFNASVSVTYSLGSTSDVLLEIYSSAGQKVATLVDERKTAGNYTIQWAPENLPSGLYFVRMKAGKQTVTRKAMCLK